MKQQQNICNINTLVHYADTISNVTYGQSDLTDVLSDCAVLKGWRLTGPGTKTANKDWERRLGQTERERP